MPPPPAAPPLEKITPVSEPDPLAVTPASGLKRAQPTASNAADVASSYEITFQGLNGLNSEAPAAPAEEPPPPGGMSDADLVSALQSDPLLAAPEEPPPPSGGDVSIDFGVLDAVPVPPAPVAPSEGFPIEGLDEVVGTGGRSGEGLAPPPGTGSLSMEEASPSAPAPDAGSLQLDNLTLDEPPPEEHSPPLMSEPTPRAGGGESASAGADPLAGLDLDFTLDDKAMGGAQTGTLPPPPAPPSAPASSIFEPTSVESAPPPPPTAASQQSLKDEFESLGRDSLIKGNLDEIQAPESPAFQAPPAPKEPEPVRPSPAPAAVAAKVAARAAEKERKVVHVRRMELRSPLWLTAPLWLVLLAGVGVAGWWYMPAPVAGASAVSDSGSIRPLLAGWIGLRPITEDASPSIRGVRGRSYRNAYGEKFYVVTGIVPRVQAETQVLRATFLDAQGWKMGQESAYWVREIPPREFALLGLRELRQALTNLAVTFPEVGAEVPFVVIYPTPLKIPDRYVLEWTDAGPRPPAGGS